MSVTVNPLAAAAIMLLSVISGASGQAVGPGDAPDTGRVGPGAGGAHDPVDAPPAGRIGPEGSVAPEGGGAHDPVPRGLRPDADFSPAQCENLLSLWSNLPPKRQVTMGDIKANCEARFGMPGGEQAVGPADAPSTGNIDPEGGGAHDPVDAPPGGRIAPE